LRVVARIGAVVLMLAAVLAAFGTARLLARIHARATARAIAAVLVLLVTAECLMWPMKLEAVEIRPGEVYAWLRNQPPGVVAELPMPASWKKDFEIGMHDSRFTYNSTFTWNPIVNGYSGFWPPSYTALIARAENFPSAEAVRGFAAQGVRYLIVHERFYGRERYAAVVRGLDAQPNLEAFGPFHEDAFAVRAYRLK